MINKTYLGTPQTYGVAVLSVALSAILRGPVLGAYLGDDAPLLVFVLPVMLAGWLGGLGPGLAATLLGALTGVYYFIDPYYTLRIASVADRMRVGLFVFEGALISAVCQRMLSTARRAKDSERAALANAGELSKSEAQAQRLLSSELEMRRQAEEASRAKDEFLATLSHELRNPLNAILGWTEMLRKGTLDAAASARALEVVSRNARAQSQLIEDLLEVSRIITGKLRLDVRPVDLTAVVEAALDTARPTAEAKNIRLQPILDPQAGHVSGDPDRLQQVVWNLLSNAIKFTPKGGRVQIRLGRVNSQIEITVLDSGSGIDPEFLPFVFDRFRQADGTSTRKHGGLGLGLAIVRHIVELHAGTVYAANVGDAHGACFTVRLPLGGVRPSGDSPEQYSRMISATAACCLSGGRLRWRACACSRWTMTLIRAACCARFWKRAERW
ncbi:MAG: ATP-binding protein [Pyrinomonadaceae bacterium]